MSFWVKILVKIIWVRQFYRKIGPVSVFHHNLLYESMSYDQSNVGYQNNLHCRNHIEILFFLCDVSFDGKPNLTFVSVTSVLDLEHVHFNNSFVFGSKVNNSRFSMSTFSSKLDSIQSSMISFLRNKKTELWGGRIRIVEK